MANSSGDKSERVMTSPVLSASSLELDLAVNAALGQTNYCPIKLLVPRHTVLYCSEEVGRNRRQP